VDGAILDEIEDQLADLGVFVLACTELVGERGQLDARGDQARQGFNDRLSIDRRHGFLMT
jgi:hypothetical protein